MKVVWRRSALADIAEMRAWIGARNPKAAARIEKRIRQIVLDTMATPLLWPMISNGVHRRIVVRGTKYVVYYRVEADRLIVAAVLHASRNRPV